ncbi:MAG TPA: hypothetical protein VF155_05765 [Candidatus Dormibacteraeota bacterium]
MNGELALRPATSPLSGRWRRGTSMVLRLAWRLVLAAAPACNLYWIVGMPPYGPR